MSNDNHSSYSHWKISLTQFLQLINIVIKGCNTTSTSQTYVENYVSSLLGYSDSNWDPLSQSQMC